MKKGKGKGKERKRKRKGKEKERENSLFLSHDDHCDDPHYVATFGPLAEPQIPAGYEPNDLIEVNNTEVTPIFFHRPSVTSTSDSVSLSLPQRKLCAKLITLPRERGEPCSYVLTQKKVE